MNFEFICLSEFGLHNLWPSLKWEEVLGQSVWCVLLLCPAGILCHVVIVVLPPAGKVLLQHSMIDPGPIHLGLGVDLLFSFVSLKIGWWVILVHFFLWNRILAWLWNATESASACMSVELPELCAALWVKFCSAPCSAPLMILLVWLFIIRFYSDHSPAGRAD